MELTNNLLFGAILVYILIILTILLLAVVFYFYLKLKIKKKKESKLEKVYKYINYNMKLVRNTLGIKKAIYFLLKQDFRKAIEDENNELGFEYVKPFDFTKLREQNVNVADLVGGIVIICEKKELLPQIFKLFIEDSEKYDFDFEKDYSTLSELAIEILNDFFFENAERML